MTKTRMKKRGKIGLAVLCVLLAGFAIPERTKIPVAGASARDWNRDSFWHEPWGSSGVHKGIDIFGKPGTMVVSATAGIVLYTGRLRKGGNVAVVLGPGWRLHYYAHLKSVEAEMFRHVAAGGRVGTLGDSGNAKGTPPHLHYSILRLIPDPLSMDHSTQGWKKAFYIDPDSYLRDSA